MQSIDPTVRRETGRIALWVLGFSLLMQGIFVLAGWWNYTVLLGNLLGAATAVGNFLLLGLMVQKAVRQDEKAAKRTVRLSQSSRLMLQGLILVLAAVLPWFNIWATALPLLFPRLGVTVRQLALPKAPASAPAAADGDDEDDDLDEDDGGDTP